jgi:uncharacterized protein (TIGR03083 family)
MTTRTYASWVEPVARQMRAARLEVLDFAKSAPAGFWARPSVLPGWTNKDLLAHIGGGNDQMLQKILRHVVAGEAVPAAVLEMDTDAENAAGVDERRDWSLARITAELQDGGEELDRLFGQLKETDAGLHPGAATWNLGGLFRLILEENHDLEHLEQLRQSMQSFGSGGAR